MRSATASAGASYPGTLGWPREKNPPRLALRKTTPRPTIMFSNTVSEL